MTRKLFNKLTLLVTLSVSPLTFASGKVVVISASPYLADSEREAIRDELVSYVLTGAPLGSKVVLLDGWNSEEKASIEIPLLRIDTPRARLTKLRQPLGHLLQFFNANESHRAELSGSGALNTPALIPAVARYEASDVMFIGHPVYHDPVSSHHNWYRNPSSEADYCLPNDAAFTVGKGASPWLVRSRDCLWDIRIHWLYPGGFARLDRPYQEAVERFYSLFFSLQGGELVAFQSDGSRALANVFNSELRGSRPELNASRTRYGMWTPVTPEVAWTGVQITDEAQALVTLPLEREIVRRFAEETEGVPFAVGLMWSAKADVDLHVWVNGSAEALYFGNKRNQWGKYIKDHRSANEGTDWEQVHLKDLPRSIDVYANLYSVDAHQSMPLRVKCMVSVRGRVSVIEVSLGAGSGDGGKGRERRDKDDCWEQIDMESLLQPLNLNLGQNE